MFTVDEVQQILTKVVDLFLIPRFLELGMPATGEWQRNVEVIANEDFGKIRGRDYSEQLAKGRRPGKKPPVAPLQKWAMAKFGMGSKEALSMAYALANKIAERGTSWFEKGGSNLIEILEEPRVIQYIEDELSAIAKVRISENLIRNAENIF